MSSLVIELGPLGVFLLMIPESACIPVPSEVTLMSAGFAVGSGLMSFWAAVLAATAGNLVGSLLAYGIGRMLSHKEHRGRSARALASCDQLLARHGSRAVFLARLMPLARTFISLPAGHARVRSGPFILMTVAGCAIWAVGFTLLGLLAGSSWSQLGNTSGGALLVLSVLVGVAWTVRKRHAARSKSSQTSSGDLHIFLP